MDQTTIKELQSINQQFYEEIAEAFNDSRQVAWSGWEKIKTILENQFIDSQEMRMLDLACGNGRWGKFFLDSTEISHCSYVGLDENETLLQYARVALLPHKKVVSLQHVELHTFLNQAVSAMKPQLYDAIVLFGVWHHVPGHENRKNVLRQLSQLLQPNGILVISCWRFLRSPQLKSRIIDSQQLQISPQSLEEGDFLLDWRSGPHAIRYCHDTQRSEIMPDAQSIGLHLLSEFTADGQTGTLNDYYCFAPQRLLATTPNSL